MKQLRLAVLVSFACGWSLPAEAQNFRGLPYFVKIESVSFTKGAAEESSNHVEACYRFGTTIPILNYTDFASKTLKGLKVKRKDIEGGVINGDAQSNGVEFQFSVSGFNAYAYLNSDLKPLSLTQLQYFNSGVRTLTGIVKPLQLLSYATDYNAMIDPQYEWVRLCEHIPFGKAYSERYVRALFRGPGPIGNLQGLSQFSFNIYPPAFISSQPLRQGFRASTYVVPIFGTDDLQTGDYRMISLSHYVNSFNAVKENLDEKALNDYLQSHQDIVQEFEALFGIKVELPVTAERLVELIQLVAGIENIPPESDDF